MATFKDIYKAAREVGESHEEAMQKCRREKKRRREFEKRTRNDKAMRAANAIIYNGK